MKTKKNIIQLEDIKLLVDSFYTKVRNDELLAPIFNERIKDKWPQHLDKMYRFWETVLLETHSYHGSPFAPHAALPIDAQHFDKWLELFQSTLDEYFEGEKADEAHWRASKMAEMFQMKLNYFRYNHSKPIV
jgi:hemoglobin